MNKGESGEFIGFGAFAAPADGPSTLDGASSSDKVTASTAPSSKTMALQPIYTGDNNELSLIFQRIGQKRDATTKVKALNELLAFFADDSEQANKKQKAEALSHFCYLFHTKLFYDNATSIRAASVSCLKEAAVKVPKAWINLTTKVQPEIAGMAFCLQGDPASEVRAAATSFWDTIGGYETTDACNNLKSAFDVGVSGLVTRILTYGRPSAMHEALFAKKNESKLSEAQTEELEEKFERIVGTIVRGFQRWLSIPHEESSEVAVDSKLLWKHLSSNKSSIRRNAYELLVLCCQNAQYLVNPDKIEKQLAQNLSSEKDPSVIPIMIETVLAFLSFLPNDERQGVVEASFVKPVMKLLKRGCYGAPASKWAPAILAFVAMPPNLAVRISVLESLWEGRTSVIGTADTLEVGLATAESSSFLLAKTEEDTKNSADAIAKKIADCWVGTLHLYLTCEASGVSRSVHRRLAKSLASQVIQLESASLNEKTTIAKVKDYLWKDQVLKSLTAPGSNQAHIAILLSELEAAILSKQSNPLSHGENDRELFTLLASKFQHDLTEYQCNKSLLPQASTYDCWIPTFGIVRPDILFASHLERSVEDFFKKDLLRWLVLHTSTTSAVRDAELTKKAFLLLQKYWQQVASIWPVLLEGLIECHCDMELLTCGLSVLLEGDCPAEEIRCLPLDSFCITVAKESVEELDQPESDEDLSQATEIHAELYGQTKGFLRFCSGVSGTTLIGDGVYDEWLKYACQTGKTLHAEETKNPVLEVLVELTRVSTKWDESPSDQLIVESWKHGGQLWESVAQDIMALPGSASTFVQTAKQFLSSSILACDESKHMDDKRLVANRWARLAFRLWGFCKAGTAKGLNGVPPANISAVGLDDLSFWSRHQSYDPTDIIHLSLLSLMEQMSDMRDRLSLFENVEDMNHRQLLVQIFTSLSAGSSGLDLVQAASASQRLDNCSALLELLGGSELPVAVLRSLVDETIRQAASDESYRTGKLIAVLSQLLNLLAPMPTFYDKAVIPKITAADIEEGEEYYYLPDTKHPELVDKVTILKVHRDIPSELYFTIVIEKDGKRQERQTVAERLRPYPDYSPPRENQSFDVKKHRDIRKEYAQSLFDSLIKPFYKRWTSVSFETLNIILSQCGLGLDTTDRGIGSNRFEIFKILSETQEQLVNSLRTAEDDHSRTVDLLWSLVVALGYGVNARRSPEIMLQINFDATRSISELLQHFSKHGYSVDSRLNVATIAFLTVTLPSIDDNELLKELRSISHGLSLSVLAETDSRTFCSSHIVALRAISATQTLDLPPDPSEDDIYSKILELFVGSSKPSSPSNGILFEVIDGALKHKPSAIASAAKANSNTLVSSLFTASKRSVALRILCCFAESEVPLFEEPPELLNDHTQKLVEKWEASMIEEEKEELDEDVRIVAQFIPERLMNEVEQWYNTQSEDRDESELAVSGRFVSWLCFLRFAQMVSSKDSFNRQAFISYVGRSNALVAILGDAVAFAQLEKGNKKSSTDEFNPHAETDVLSGEISQLAKLVIFRSIEIFPTLTKHWWEMDCPKYSSQNVLAFVESSVSMEILKGQLSEIGKAEAFGDMNVTGNSASREVTATYVQDDFTLSVIIKLPLSFPFRRAEVDCSKTLGVPESRWKRWALQITMMLNNQGGTLQDALLLWKENVDKEFEGVEPCPICYSVLHVKTHKLPEMECKTCCNRFHTDCLTQWFRNSGKSACVICQQPWSGTRV